MRIHFLVFVLLATSVVSLNACSTSNTQPISADDQSEVVGLVGKAESETNENLQSADQDRASPEPAYAGTIPAPEFPTDLDWLNTDQPLSFAQLQGKIVVLDFWTYGCINCMHVIPDYLQLEHEYPQELVVIGVHSAKFENEGETENIRQVILRYGIEHPVVNDKDFRVWRSWGAQAWPTLALIDPVGNVVGLHSGEGVYQVLKPIIEELVEQFEATGELDRTPLAITLEREGLPKTVLSFPGKVLADPSAQRLFIADTEHNRIVVTDIETGETIELFGSGERGFQDGSPLEASFNLPQGMALSSDGGTLFVADTDNHAVRQIDLDSGRVATLVGLGFQASTYPPLGGLAPNVELSSPWDLALDRDILYIAMAGSHQIWSVDLTSGQVQPYAGSGREGTLDGSLERAELAQPSGLALDQRGRLYFADSEGSSIRWAEVGSDENAVGTLVGSGESLFDFGDIDGTGNEVRLQHPLGIATNDKYLYIADTYNHKIKRIDPSTFEAVTVAGGTNGWRDGESPLFYEPGGIDIAEGQLYIADTNNHAIRIMDLESGVTRTLVVDGIERFIADEDDAFPGEIVSLDLMTMNPGAGNLRLNFELPEGYKVNDLAPSSISWRSEGGILDLTSLETLSLVGQTFPLDQNVVFTEGEGELVGDLALYYCEYEKESLCFIELVRFKAPIRVETGGLRSIQFDHTLTVPAVAASGDG